MALIKCPECGQQVSNKAEVCIHCDAPLKEKPLEPVYISFPQARYFMKGNPNHALQAEPSALRFPSLQLSRSK